MKLLSLIVLLAPFFLSSCANDVPSGPPPFMGIANAKKLGKGPSDSAKYEVKVHYENLQPEKYEIKIGFGYVPSDENLSRIAASAQGIYSIAYSEVVHNTSGDLVVTIEPTGIRNLGTLDDKIHAILSKYPHGKEWIIARHDVFALAPD